MELQDRHRYLKPFFEHKKYSLFVLLFGLIIGWNARPLLENPMVNFFSVLTAEQWLVLVTVGYVILTFRLVNETKRGREEDRRRELQRQEREVETLRRALLAEINQNLNKLDALDTSRTNIEFGGDVFYSEIYLGNTDRIGILTPSEGEAVVDAFTDLVENQRLVRKGLEEDDDRHGKGSTVIASTRFESLQRNLVQARNEILENTNPSEGISNGKLKDHL